jgi:hypothetical protein
MRIGVVPNETIPAFVYRLLLPHEHRVLITVRLHPAYLFPSAAMAFGGVLAALATQPVTRGDLGLRLAVWLLAGVLVVQCVLAVYSWFDYHFVVTSSRILVCQRSLFRSEVRVSLPLSQLADLRLQRSAAGRLFGYGSLISDSAGLTLGFIPYPEQLYLEVTGLLFKDPGTDDD